MQGHGALYMLDKDDQATSFLLMVISILLGPCFSGMSVQDQDIVHQPSFVLVDHLLLATFRREGLGVRFVDGPPAQI